MLVKVVGIIPIQLGVRTLCSYLGTEGKTVAPSQALYSLVTE